MQERRRIIDDQLYAHFITFSVVRRRRLLDHDHPKAGRLSQFMRENPVRAGLVERATDWKWSSARWPQRRHSVGVPTEWVERSAETS